MKKTFKLHWEKFMSSSQKTPQYKTYHRTFKREFTQALESMGCRDIKICPPNHFDVTGFFTAPGGQMWYFSVGDLRLDKERMLIRTAKHDKDWTGGGNQWVSMGNELEFLKGISKTIKNFTKINLQ